MKGFDNGNQLSKFLPLEIEKSIVCYSSYYDGRHRLMRLADIDELKESLFDPFVHLQSILVDPLLNFVQCIVDIFVDLEIVSLD
jgi:hypothetical protein